MYLFPFVKKYLNAPGVLACLASTGNSNPKDCVCILGQVWYLIVSISDLCTLTYFNPYILENKVYF